MSNVWYCSDLHVGHRLVAGLRGFLGFDGDGHSEPDTNAHDEHLARVWDATVGPKDTVWILGDISINGGQHALDWIAERPGTKHLIAGNHDPVHPLDRRSAGRMSHWNKYFESIQPFARRKLDGINFLLQHFPYWPLDRPGIEPRYEQYRLPDLGLPLVHGHTHSDQIHEFPRHYHVGWDAHGALVEQQAIYDWLHTL